MFCQCHLLWYIIIATTTFFIYVDGLPSLSASARMMVSPRAAGPQSHHLMFLLWLHLGAAEISLPVLPLSFLCCTFIFAGNSLSMIHFGKISHGFFFTEREGSNTTTHVAWMTGALRPVTDRVWKKGRDWPLIVMLTCLHSDGWTEELATRFVH